MFWLSAVFSACCLIVAFGRIHSQHLDLEDRRGLGLRKLCTAEVFEGHLKQI